MTANIVCEKIVVTCNTLHHLTQSVNTAEERIKLSENIT